MFFFFFFALLCLALLSYVRFFCFFCSLVAVSYQYGVIHPLLLMSFVNAVKLFKPIYRLCCNRKLISDSISHQCWLHLNFLFLFRIKIYFSLFFFFLWFGCHCVFYYHKMSLLCTHNDFIVCYSLQLTDSHNLAIRIE